MKNDTTQEYLTDELRDEEERERLERIEEEIDTLGIEDKEVKELVLAAALAVNNLSIDSALLKISDSTSVRIKPKDGSIVFSLTVRQTRSSSVKA